VPPSTNVNEGPPFTSTKWLQRSSLSVDRFTGRGRSGCPPLASLLIGKLYGMPPRTKASEWAHARTHEMIASIKLGSRPIHRVRPPWLNHTG
jgi:hypothetical protein